MVAKLQQHVSLWDVRLTWNIIHKYRFAANGVYLTQGCSQYGVPNNSDGEIEDIYNSIVQISSKTNVDARFILAIMIEESSGCVRAPSTSGAVRNPGLMQSHNGVGTCNDQGQVQNPCPTQQIFQMILDGVNGTPSGDGLLQLLQSSGGSLDMKYFQAARKYNSGSIDSSGNLSAGVANKCYVSDIANRLIGWVHTLNTCPLMPEPSRFPVQATEMEVNFSFLPPASVRAQTAKPATAPAPQAASAAQAVPAAQVAAVNTQVKATSNKMAPGVTTNCAKYYQVQDGDYCIKVADSFKITFADLRKWNANLDDSCSNLWKGYDYCVEAL
jgi:LysM domain-containing protein